MWKHEGHFGQTFDLIFGIKNPDFMDINWRPLAVLQASLQKDSCWLVGKLVGFFKNLLILKPGTLHSAISAWSCSVSCPESLLSKWRLCTCCLSIFCGWSGLYALYVIHLLVVKHSWAREHIQPQHPQEQLPECSCHSCKKRLLVNTLEPEALGGKGVSWDRILMQRRNSEQTCHFWLNQSDFAKSECNMCCTVGYLFFGPHRTANTALWQT